jgi:hypothetical protein
MTKTILLSFFLSLSGWVYSQNMDPSVLASAGSIDSTNQLSLEWTLGEIAVATLSSETNLITEGYHQPRLIVSDFDDSSITNTSTANLDYQIMVNPNPVNSFVSVQMQSSEESEVFISLFNLEGKQLIGELKKQSSDSFEMDLSDLFSGLYLLRFTNSKGQIVRTFKVSKIN